MTQHNTAAEMIAVINAHANGESIQYSPVSNDSPAQYWIDCDEPKWAFHINHYRVKPKLSQKPSINWEHVAGRFNWLATDESGISYLYTEKPTFDRGFWLTDNDYVEVSGFSSFNPGNLSCSQSLVYRNE